MPLPTSPWRPPRPDALVLGVALVALVALVATNPGGATGDLHRAAVVALAAFVAAVHAWSRWDDGGRTPLIARAPALAVALVLVAAALQLVPLPRPVVAALSPETAALYAAEDAATSASAGARPLSIEPAATARSAVLGLAYLAVFLAARGVGRDPRAPSRVALGLGLVGGLVALGALVVQAESPAWAGRAAWPFVNPNHLATFLVVALGLALGAAIAPAPSSSGDGAHAARAAWRRGLAAIAALLCVVGVIASQSRAGAAVAALVAVLTAALSGRLRARSLFGVVVVACVIAGAALTMSRDVERLADRMETRRDDLPGRIDNWTVALRVAAGRPLGGAGLGTYDDASLAAVGPDWRTTRPGDAHNDYLELIAGVGWPAGLAAATLLLGALAATGLRLRQVADPRARAVAGGALAAVAGALAHASMDFGLQMPAVALATAVALGLTTGAVWPDHELGALGPVRAGRVGLAAALGALGVVVVVQTSREADASVLEAARGWRRDLRPELAAELARRARSSLEAADGPLAAPSVAWERALIEELAGDPGWEATAIEHARRAVQGAPGRAATQAQLGLLLLGRLGDPAAEAEGAARLALAGRLGPTVPAILLARGEWALVQLSRTGRPQYATEAVDLLAHAMRRDPSLRPAVKQALVRREALLGAQGDALKKRLGL
jgi:hypothetical protein